MKRWIEEYGLTTEAAARLEVLLDALAEPAAPTTVHDRAAAANIHIADSLSALTVPEVGAAERIADLGAGAGVPGLVLAAALPSARVALVESVAKKCAFTRRAATLMGLQNVETVCARVEEWRAGGTACDVVTARALAALPALCEYAAPLLREQGVLVAWKGDVPPGEDRDGRAAARLLGLNDPDVLHVEPYPGSRSRRLYVFRKIAPTPSRFPRRPGMATKRPLSASTSG